MLFILLMILIPVAVPFTVFGLAVGIYYVACLVRGLSQPYYMYEPGETAIVTDTFTVKKISAEPYQCNGFYYHNDYEED